MECISRRFKKIDGFLLELAYPYDRGATGSSYLIPFLLGVYKLRLPIYSTSNSLLTLLYLMSSSLLLFRTLTGLSGRLGLLYLLVLLLLVAVLSVRGECIYGLRILLSGIDLIMIGVGPV